LPGFEKVIEKLNQIDKTEEESFEESNKKENE
jgi:hypothetical protein